MTIRKLLATDPYDGQYLDLLRAAYQYTNPQALRAAVAYATQSGVAELDNVFGQLTGWNDVDKRWLVGIDYCRSDPVALAHLSGLQASKVRIFDGKFVSERKGCVPKHSYHPKVYFLQGNKRSAVIVGSGNLSRTGLRLGIEAAATVVESEENAIKDIRIWFSNHWGNATPFDNIEDRYEKEFSSINNRRHPIPIEEDEIPESASNRGQIHPHELRKLRVCRHLWINAGNLHRNRGPGRPGNQLMLKRNSRVFFGFSAHDLVPNSHIGHIAIRFAQRLREDCPLRFSDNSMDVLTLPIPGTEGPQEYDGKTLLFTRVGIRQFDLTIGRRRDAANWRSRSRTIEGHFRMNSGREWGVY